MIVISLDRHAAPDGMIAFLGSGDATCAGAFHPRTSRIAVLDRGWLALS
jgi:hypothetical protein